MRGKPAAEPALETVALPPRANTELFGHEAAEQMLRSLFEAGKLPHALLLTGPRGIGKATLAFRLARFILAGGVKDAGLFGSSGAVDDPSSGLWIAPDSGPSRRIAAGGHADLLTIERAYDPRRRRVRSEIVVDDTREISAFLRLTAAEGGWRVVIVDGADEMNRNAANALLKILEEPPRDALLILVAHSPGLLLPTIRSRCRRFPLAALPDAVVRRLLAGFRPDLSPADTDAVVELAGGSIGRALDLAAAGGVELYDALLKLIDRRQGLDVAAAHAFADKLARADAEDAYRAVEDLVGQILARLAIASARTGEAGPAISSPLLRELSGRAPAVQWADLREEIAGSFTRTDDLNLDRKQTILGAFFAIDAVAR